jgi:hypothetical protein
MPYGMDLDKDGFADNQNVVGRNDWKSLFHHNNSRAERLLETAISSGVWAECDDVIQ